MPETLMSTVTRISPVHMSNTFSRNVNTTGATAILTTGTTAGIKVYESLDKLEADYPETTSLYKKGQVYFANNGEAVSLIVLTSTKATAAGEGTPAPKDDVDNAISVVKKYLYAGWDFLVLDKPNADLMAGISNFMELQNTGLFFAYSNTADDLSKLQLNKRTVGLTNPAATTEEVADGTYLDALDIAVTAKLGMLPPHAALKYTLGDLKYIKPQDRFDFTPDDLKLLDDKNIITYAFVGANPALTSSRTMGTDMHIDIMRGLDWVQNLINSRVVELFKNSQDNGIPYTELGFKTVIDTIRTVFSDAFNMGIVAPKVDENGNENGMPDYSVEYVKPGKLSQSYEQKREMRGVTTSYKPAGMVEDVYISNTIEY